MSEEQVEEVGGNTDDDMGVLNDNTNPPINTIDKEAYKQQVLEKINLFKMIHENKCEDGKDISAEAREKLLNEIKGSYDELDEQLELEVYVVRVLRWKTYREDLKYWELWDKKEEFIRKNGRNRDREKDRMRSRYRQDDRDNYRSRSRSRSRDRIRVDNVQRNRSRDNNGHINDNNNRADKERVK